MVDAWAQGGYEGRGKLRKASGRCKRPLIRRDPNGVTRLVEDQSLCIQSKRRELKHLSTCRKRKQNVIPQVVASERGVAQTRVVSAASGVVGPRHLMKVRTGTCLERQSVEGERPVQVRNDLVAVS